jgi:LAGLIDADG endonuclease
MISEDLAWAAGFLDGEGCFTINGAAGGRSVQPLIAVTQVRRKPLDKLAEMFGGNVRPQRHRQGHTYFQWVITGSRLTVMIPLVLPYLVLKKDEAQAILDFAQTTVRRNGTRITPQEAEIRENSIQALALARGRNS